MIIPFCSQVYNDELYPLILMKNHDKKGICRMGEIALKELKTMVKKGER